MRDIDPTIVAQLRAKELKPVLTMSMSIDGSYYRYTDLDVPLGEQLREETITNTPVVHGLSLVDDQAFARLEGFDLSPYQNSRWKLTLTDSADKTAYGYIGAVGTGETLGSEIATGTLTAKKLYQITATEEDHFFVGCDVDDYFTSDGTEDCDASNKVKEVTSPAADGVYIMDGETSDDQGWTIEVDFDYNDTSYIATVSSHRYEPRGAKLEAVRYSLNTVVDSMRIEIDNLDDALTAAFVGGTPQGSEVVLQQVLLNANNQPIGEPIVWFRGTIDEWSLNEEKVSFTVASELVQWSQKTLGKHSASCRWREFAGTRCAYAGAKTWCDRSYTRCVALGNQNNFGGFRWLPSIVDAEIWWGRARA